MRGAATLHIRKTQRLPVRSTEDLLQVRQTIRTWAAEAGFTLVEQTKLITAASELARNTVIHGGGGTLVAETVDDGNRSGVRLTFEDRGPGIADLDLAMKDGYSSGGGLGLGLGGAKRLSNEFHIESKPGEGTRVTITRWKSAL